MFDCQWLKALRARSTYIMEIKESPTHEQILIHSKKYLSRLFLSFV